MNQRVHLEQKHCSKYIPQIKEKARECSPGEPVSKECAAEGKGDERTVIGNVLGRRSRAHSGTAWATAGGGGGGLSTSSAFGKELQERKKSATLLQKSLQNSGLDGCGK